MHSPKLVAAKVVQSLRTRAATPHTAGPPPNLPAHQTPAAFPRIPVLINKLNTMFKLSPQTLGLIGPCPDDRKLETDLPLPQAEVATFRVRGARKYPMQPVFRAARAPGLPWRGGCDPTSALPRPGQPPPHACTRQRIRLIVFYGCLLRVQGRAASKLGLPTDQTQDATLQAAGCQQQAVRAREERRRYAASAPAACAARSGDVAEDMRPFRHLAQ